MIFEYLPCASFSHSILGGTRHKQLHGKCSSQPILCVIKSLLQYFHVEIIIPFFNILGKLTSERLTYPDSY